jgi:cellulose synthase/poly-beta-1,6-N-acetylglucosamine synthase-like glycosyltransferase
MAEFLFWFSAFLVAYIYIGYPLLLWLIAQLYRNPAKTAAFAPQVTIIIPAFNEARFIAGTIENKLALQYPADRIEIIVVSDESTDGTDEIVNSYADRGVKLIRQQSRQGKTAGLNRAVAQAVGEIIVFSDANSMYATDALSVMLSNFSDPRVGYVTGKMVYTDPDGTIIGDGCSAYMKYENFIRGLEGSINSLVGVDGGIDAVRKDLYEDMRADQLPDFVLPLTVVSKGYRVVYEPCAILKEHSLTSAASEYRMRVRVSLRAMWALLDMRHLLSPSRFPLYAWQLFSHKVLRYLAFVPMLVMLISNLYLLDSFIYFILFAGQLAFYGAALKGHRSADDNMPLYISLPYYFVVLNIACAHAFYRFIKGEKQVLWNPRVG